MTKPLRDTVIRTHDDLLTTWRELMGEEGFAYRSLWLIFLDEHGRPAPVIVPVDGVPPEPDDEELAGIVGFVDRLRRELDVWSVPMLLARPGTSAMTDADRRWAVALTRAFADLQPQWPLHLATEGRVQVFSPDELLAVEAA
ncbi:hypothetical protein [Luteipulveratus halotolerans]|uniref:hypothetical protein n=1 Tax=Luteipulveratus halotolerans TaxID=1631356 RepID=UPI0012FCF5C7|nr:hypothetical protein [Luteipulveratus halotolerans]